MAASIILVLILSGPGKLAVLSLIYLLAVWVIRRSKLFETRIIKIVANVFF